MQAKQQPKPPVGVIFDSSLEDIDHVLALSLLYGLQTAREARIASLSVSSPGLRAAAFADALARFLAGPANRGQLPIGVPPAGAVRNSVMAETVVAAYPHGIQKLNDTADEAALIRNAISAQQPGNGAVVLAGPASNVARALALTGCSDLAAQRVRTLVIASDDGARALLVNWPTPIVWVGPEVGEALRFPSSEVADAFKWAPNHPVADAYRAFKTMPYDAPMRAAAAALYAVRPDSPFFKLSERNLVVIPDKKQAAIDAMVKLIAAQPPQPQRGRGAQQDKQ